MVGTFAYFLSVFIDLRCPPPPNNIRGLFGIGIIEIKSKSKPSPRGNGKYLLSFIGFAPVENPQVVVYVTVDEPNVEDQASSGLGTIIAHSIFEELLPYMNIYQTNAENKSVGEDIGDETATPIFDGNVSTMLFTSILTGLNKY